jgi:hypothetical protein
MEAFQMHYIYKREAKVMIAHALEKNGWKVYGYHEDQSDSMTDYYHPASWDGIATKNGHTLVIDNSNTYYSGYEVKKYNYSARKAVVNNNNKIEKLRALANDEGATEGEKAAAREGIERLTGKEANDEPTWTVIGTYPTFAHGNPGKCSWHIEKDGQILAKGTGVFACNEYDWEDKTKTAAEQKQEKVTDIIARFEKVLGDSDALQAEVIKVEKKIIKHVEIEKTSVTESEITECFTFIMKIDYTGGNWKGNKWQMVRRYDSEKSGANFIFQRLGKRGKPVNGDWWLSVEKLNKILSKGHIAIVEMQEVTEYEEKTVFKKTGRKQPQANFDNDALPGDVEEETTEETTQESAQAKKQTVKHETVSDNDQATKKQLWALHCATKLNTTNLFITKTKASELISKSKAGTDITDEVKALLGIVDAPEVKEESIKVNAQESQQNDEDPADWILDYATSIIMDDNTDSVKKPETEEEKADFRNKIIEYVKYKGDSVTQSLINHFISLGSGVTILLIVEALQSLNGSHNSIDELKQDDYTFNIDSSYLYHDIHFKAWNMEIEQIEPYLNVREIPFYIAGDKFICKGLTIEQVQFIEGLNASNQAILFYDDKYNEKPNNSTRTEELENQNENTILSSDNIIYHNFTSNQTNKEETENEYMIDDDFLSKFDNVEVTNESKIAADDLEFCKEQEDIYKKLISTYNSFSSQLQDISKLTKSISENYTYTNNGYTHRHDTAYSSSFSQSDINEKINKMKDRFISTICYYFERKYNITIQEEKIQKKYKESVTLENILDEIHIQLEGFNFTEKAEKEIKDKSKEIVRNSDKITIKNNKLIIDAWFSRLDSIWKEYRTNGERLTNIFNALQHFENGQIKGNEELTKKYIGYDNERSQSNYERYEPTTLSKVASIKILKNGKLEIEFKSNQQATQFAKVYCGYNQKSA